MKTIYEVLVAAGPLLEDIWNSHSEIPEGAVRTGKTCGEALTKLELDPILGMQVADAVLTFTTGKMPTTLDGLKDFWRALIAKHRP